MPLVALRVCLAIEFLNAKASLQRRGRCTGGVAHASSSPLLRSPRVAMSPSVRRLCSKAAKAALRSLLRCRCCVASFRRSSTAASPRLHTLRRMQALSTSDGGRGDATLCSALLTVAMHSSTQRSSCGRRRSEGTDWTHADRCRNAERTTPHGWITDRSSRRSLLCSRVPRLSLCRCSLPSSVSRSHRENTGALAATAATHPHPPP